jgi:phosphate transport system substrate-binding protein
VWAKNVRQYGIKVNYAGTGSSDGRNQFRNRTVDFGVSEIPYGLTDGGVLDAPPDRHYGYMPIVAGGTSFMYNLKIGGRRVTNLRLSGENLAKIFTGNLTQWNDPAIAADNPGLTLPFRKIVPVVRSDGSGTTAQLTTWLSKRYPRLWDDYCVRAGRSRPCGVTSQFPLVASAPFTAQPGSNGVAGYVHEDGNQGTINYVEYAYALDESFPVVKVLNQAGYYVEPHRVQRGRRAAQGADQHQHLLVRVPHPDPGRRLRLQRPAHLPAVQLQLYDHPYRAGSAAERQQGLHPGQFRVLLPVRGPAAR